MNNRALILLSGGLDSATTAAIAIRDGNECSALTFAYGQKHSVEISFARRLAEYFKIRNHLVVTIPQELFTASSLSRGSGKKIPKGRDVGALEGIPSTYVPARNILFLSYALACAENSAISEIYIGVNSLDYSGYPDCRPEFIEAFEAMANIGTKSAAEGRLFHIRAPLMRLKKWEIIRLGMDLGVDYSLTHSCYDPDADGASCGACDSCLLRRQGFLKAGVEDPTRYRNRS